MNAPVIGNGTCIGLDCGINGLSGLATGANGAVGNIGGLPGLHTGYVFNSTNIGTAVAVATGLTTDPTKSGLIANLDNIEVGKINSLKLGKYILKY